MNVAKIDRYDFLNNPGGTTASMTVWFSGCNMMPKCKGCQNKELWDKGADNYTPQSLSNLLMTYAFRLQINDIVLLGGDPLFQNREDLIYLCKSLYEFGLSVWLYTGHEFEEIDEELLKYIKTVKCGRYDENLLTDGFPASSNQRVMRRYRSGWVDITNKFKKER